MEPKSPAGYFYLAMVYQARMKDLESDLYEKEFLQNLNKVIELTKPKEEKKTADKWELLFWAMPTALWATFKPGKGAGFPGSNQPKRPRSFRKAIQQDSTFWEAYFGLGSYHYWKSVATKFINWLPFIGDHRQKGIQQLLVASEKAVFFRSRLSWD